MKKGWEYKKLGEIATEMYRGSGIKRDQITNDGCPCVRYGEIYTTYNYWFDKCVSHTNESLIKPNKYFENGDILFAITGESVEDIGKSIAYIGNEKCLAGGDIVVMKHRENAKYLSYALAAPNSIRQKGFGKTKLKVVHTNVPSLKDIEIPVPPLPEQQRIVNYLDTQFAKIDQLKANAEKQLQAAKDMFQKALKEMLEPKKGWEEKKLGEMCSICGEYGLNESATNYNGIRYIRITDITDDGDLNDEKVSATNGNKKNQEKLEVGDILFARTGATVGKTLVYRKDFGECVFAGYLIRYRTNPDIILPKYLFYFTHSSDYYEWVKINQAAAAQPNISAQKYNGLVIAFPKDTKIQQQIADKLDALSAKVKALQSNYTETITLCNDIKQSLLRKIFE